MLRISFNFRWAPFMAFYQHAQRIAPKGHRRRILLRISQHHAFRLLYVRNDVLL